VLRILSVVCLAFTVSVPASAQSPSQREAGRLLNIASTNPAQLLQGSPQLPDRKQKMIACFASMEQTFTDNAIRASELATAYCRRVPNCRADSSFHKALSDSVGMAISSRWASLSLTNPTAIQAEPMFPLRQQAAQVLIQALPMAAAGWGMSVEQFQAFFANYYLFVATTLCPSL